MVSVSLLAAGLSLLIAAPAASQGAGGPLEISLDGVVDPLAARYVERGIKAAADHSAVVLRIDTPGGLDSSMRRIIKAIHAYDKPLVCWVGPSGARAASAGAIIMLGCPFATMAPGTNVGAAHPVGITGEILAEKVTNDAAAYARSLAQERGRDADVAERMVRESISLSAEDALDGGVIDAIASDERAALRALADDRLPGSENADIRYHIAEVAPQPFQMTIMESLLHNAVDPSLAFLLLLFGIVGIISEVLHPGITVGGVFGGISLLAALVILGMLPVNIAGLFLVLVGIGLMVAEVYVPGGIVGFFGLCSLVAGGLFLFDSAIPSAQVSKGVLIGTVLAVVAFFLTVVRALVKTRRQGVTARTIEDLVGLEGEVVRSLDPIGIVRAGNEDWTARSVAGVIGPGVRVRVTRVDGLTLEVEPVEESTIVDA